MASNEVKGLIQVTIGMVIHEQSVTFESGEDLAGFSRGLTHKIIDMLERHGFEIRRKGGDDGVDG